MQHPGADGLEMTPARPRRSRHWYLSPWPRYHGRLPGGGTVWRTRHLRASDDGLFAGLHTPAHQASDCACPLRTPRRPTRRTPLVWPDDFLTVTEPQMLTRERQTSAIHPSKRCAPARNAEVCSNSDNDRQNACPKMQNKSAFSHATGVRASRTVAPRSCNSSLAIWRPLKSHR